VNPGSRRLAVFRQGSDVISDNNTPSIGTCFFSKDQAADVVIFCELVHKACFSKPSLLALKSLFSVLSWTWAVALLSLFEQSTTVWQNKWAKFLACNGVTSVSYPMEALQWPYVNYVKLSGSESKAYMGSTSKTMCGRESTRRRKFRQKLRVRKEPALLYWARRGNFFKFCPIV
jgi:hypothetical protein